jgi:tetratricopeptide (TPR) repeat protein
MKKQSENWVEASYRKAFQLKTHGSPQQAYILCEQILKTIPKQAETLSLMGIILGESNQKFAALEYFTKSIEARKNASAYNNRANLYQELKQYELALEDYDMAIKLNKKLVEAYYNKANCLRELHQMDEAIKVYKEAIQCDPSYHNAYTNLGMSYQNLQQHALALEYYEKALKIKPDDYYLHNNKGYALHVLMRIDESIAAYERARDIDPKATEAKFNVGFLYLLKGEMEKGWKAHEERWDSKFRPMKLKNLWTGEDLTGKVIYVHHEQGLGDTIQFIRYAKHLKKLGAKRVIAGVKPEIASLISTMPDIDEVRIGADDIPEYDYQCPMMSLPYILKNDLTNIPKETYLKADPEKVHEFSKKIPLKNNKLRVGLVWSGGFRKEQPELWAVNERRNIPISKLSEIKRDDVEFYSLQIGEKTPEWMVDLTGDLKDFSDTAALIENLDLVISVDTSTAHVAGAIGKPVWLLNRFDTCWRWLATGSKTDWYPSFTIYRQNKLHNWDNVVEDIKKDLDALVSSK